MSESPFGRRITRRRDPSGQVVFRPEKISTRSAVVTPTPGRALAVAKMIGVRPSSTDIRPGSAASAGVALTATSTAPACRALMPPRLPRPGTMATFVCGWVFWNASPARRMASSGPPVPATRMVSAPTGPAHAAPARQPRINAMTLVMKPPLRVRPDVGVEGSRGASESERAVGATGVAPGMPGRVDSVVAWLSAQVLVNAAVIRPQQRARAGSPTGCGAGFRQRAVVECQDVEEQSARTWPGGNTGTPPTTANRSRS